MPSIFYKVESRREELTIPRKNTHNGQIPRENKPTKLPTPTRKSNIFTSKPQFTSKNAPPILLVKNHFHQNLLVKVTSNFSNLPFYY